MQMSKFCFPEGDIQVCYKAEDYHKMGRDAPSWEEPFEVELVGQQEYEPKPGRK